MISGVKIPVFCPYKFYPVTADFDNGINFNNTDNRKAIDQSWAGVWPQFFAQPVPYYWYDFTPGLDFQVYATAANYADVEAYIIDEDGNEIAQLTKEVFFNYTSDRQLRFYLTNIYGITADYHRIKIEYDGTAIYYSELIEFGEYFNHCFPFEFSNFENDFGCIFDNGSGSTWTGKLLIPMRMFQPAPVDERETYMDDSGTIETLRSIPKRGYLMESLPVSAWMGEKIRLMFSCSEIVMNKLDINIEESPEIEPVSESNLVTVSGEVYLNDFAGEYWQDEQISTVTELLTSWTDTDSDVVVFETTGKEITAMITDDSASQEVESNTIAIVEDASYIITFDVKDYNRGRVLASDPYVLASMDFILASMTKINSDNIDITIDGDTYNLSKGLNIIHHVGNTTGNSQVIIEPESGHDIIYLTISPSMKKIS